MKDVKFYQIPSNPAYEISKHGVVRNIKTKRILSNQVSLYTNPTQSTRTVNSLLWEVFGDKKALKNAYINHVKVTFDGKEKMFESLLQAAKFISKYINIKPTTVRQKIARGVTKFDNFHVTCINKAQGWGKSVSVDNGVISKSFTSHTDCAVFLKEHTKYSSITLQQYLCRRKNPIADFNISYLE